MTHPIAHLSERLRLRREERRQAAQLKALRRDPHLARDVGLAPLPSPFKIGGAPW